MTVTIDRFFPAYARFDQRRVFFLQMSKVFRWVLCQQCRRKSRWLTRATIWPNALKERCWRDSPTSKWRSSENCSTCSTRTTKVTIIGRRVVPVFSSRNADLVHIGQRDEDGRSDTDGIGDDLIWCVRWISTVRARSISMNLSTWSLVTCIPTTRNKRCVTHSRCSITIRTGSSLSRNYNQPSRSISDSRWTTSSFDKWWNSLIEVVQLPSRSKISFTQQCAALRLNSPHPHLHLFLEWNDTGGHSSSSCKRKCSTNKFRAEQTFTRKIKADVDTRSRDDRVGERTYAYSSYLVTNFTG